MQVSQKQIADRLKVSISTVSKSLRNSSEIPPHTRAQVLELASVLGYRPVSARVGHNTDETSTHTAITVMIQTDGRVGTMALRYATEVLLGVTEVAQAEDVSVGIHYVPLALCDKILVPENQPIAMRQNKIHGLILVHYFTPEIVDGLRAKLPLVTVANRYDKVDCVDNDQISTMLQCVGHLYQLGHRRIGFLPGQNYQSWLQGRYAGYIQALAKYGLEYDPAIADIRTDTTTNDPAMVERIIHLTRSQVTAWICGSDAIGYVWLDRFIRAGLRVPQDVSLTGVDAETLPPMRLTSIRVPCADLGRAAMTRLLGRIRGPLDAPYVVQLSGTLVPGETTAAPRAVAV